MNFAHPYQFFWLIPLLLFSIALIWSSKSKSALVQKLIDADLVEKIFPFSAWKSLSVKKNLILVLGILVLVLALAGPEIGQRLESVTVKGENVFILFDCSDSMQAEDFKPTRLEKSKRLLTGLLEKIHGNRVGIIAFAGEAYIYCPMTFDLSTAKQFLKSIEPGMIPQPGTQIGKAIRLAVSKMAAENGSGSIVLLTDGEDHKSDPEGAAEEAKAKEIRIFAIGIGSAEGEPIPIRDAGGSVTGYKKNKKGEVVLSRLDETTLAKVSSETGGAYFRASETEQEIDLLADQLSQSEKNPVTQKRNIYENRYQWFLFLSLFLLILSESLGHFSRKLINIFVIGLILLPAFLGVARAAGFSQKIREGNKLYGKGNYSEAAESYNEAGLKSPSDLRANFNRGDALYKMQDWDKAKEEFQKSAMSKDSGLTAKSLYNMGNNFFQQGNYRQAAEAYKQNLRLNPYDEDAKHNLRLSLQFMQKPPPQKNKNNKDDKHGKNPQSQARKAVQDDQKKEKEENAKRILKSAAGDDKNKPIFNPDAKGKNKKNYEEDW